jgi:AcrR family transcriptional regulator
MRPKQTTLTVVSMVPGDPDLPLRNPPTQARSLHRLRLVLDVADELLASEGAESFTTTRVAEAAGIPVGSVYRFFDGKEAIAEALAVRYWRDFDDLVAGVAEADERDRLADPAGAVLEVLASGFRARPGFLALWYGGLRTERVRDATRHARTAIAGSIERILAVHWPGATSDERSRAARMVVLAGDGLLREAFRIDPTGDPDVLAESKLMLDAYLSGRLGGPAH